MRHWKVILLSSFLWLANQAAGQAPDSNEASSQPREARQFLLNFQGKTEDLASLLQKYNAIQIRQVGPHPIFVIEFPEGSHLKDVVSRMSREAGVKSLEPELKIRSSAGK